MSRTIRKAAKAAPGTGYAVKYGQHFTEEIDDLSLFSATRAIVVAARTWRKTANERIMPLGQTMARWETLYHVAVTDEEISQRDLARLVGVEGPTMARMLDRLARDGLIKRSQSANDRRVTYNRITAEGYATVKRIMAVTNEVRGDVLREIDPARLAICVEVLDEIIERLRDGS